MMLAAALALMGRLAPAAVEQADTAWAERRYADAAEAYARAYAETGDIAYVYARAQAQREAGDCVGATATYRAFIATQPLPEAIAAAEQAIEQCRARLPPPEPSPAAPADPTVATLPPAAAVDRPPPWQRDPAAIVLVTLGSAAVVSGAVLAIVARTQQDAAERAGDVVDYADHNDRAVTLSRASIPLLAIGGALLVGGAVRYGLLARKQRTARARVQLAPTLSIRF